jgi:hypothetical protein
MIEIAGATTSYATEASQALAGRSSVRRLDSFWNREVRSNMVQSSANPLSR